MPDPKPREQAIVIDGVVHTLDDLTFREQHALRNAVRELSGDATQLPGDAAFMDFLPALAYVIKRRTEPAYTLDQALDLVESDVLAERPTPAADAASSSTAKATRRGGSGTRATS